VFRAWSLLRGDGEDKSVRAEHEVARDRVPPALRLHLRVEGALRGGNDLLAIARFRQGREGGRDGQAARLERLARLGAEVERVAAGLLPYLPDREGG